MKGGENPTINEGGIKFGRGGKKLFSTEEILKREKKGLRNPNGRLRRENVDMSNGV